MTLQVAMVATDGIVLASDTRWIATPKVWQTTNSTKITISDERGIAIASARNMELSVMVARAIIAELKDEEWAHPCISIEKIAARLVDQSSEDRRDVHCLIVLAQPTRRLFFLSTGTYGGRAHTPVCLEEQKTVIAGDIGNAATFFIQRYYSPKPMRDLLSLAAHLITAGSKLNPYGIDDLEIVACDKTGLHRLSEDSIRQLKLRALALDESIGASLSQVQEFTYAPNVIG